MGIKNWICPKCQNEWQCDHCDCDQCHCGCCGDVGLPVLNSVGGPEVVTTKTTIIYEFPPREATPNENLETVQERNDRIWQAIKGVSGG